MINMNKSDYLGGLISRERLEKNWSQEGLCKGICSVSYLSKIESGKAEASEEILSLLFAKLGIDYSPEKEEKAAAIVTEAKEKLFTGEFDSLREFLSEEVRKSLVFTSSALEMELIFACVDEEHSPMPAEMEKSMNREALALQRILQQRYEEAIALLPNAFSFYNAGADAYSKGEYSSAMEYLSSAYNNAAADGSPKLMLLCKLFLSACCANCQDMAAMEKHNKAARRLALALGAHDALEEMDYNSAATALECGQYERAYSYFSALKYPNIMSLHKLAIACEKTGRGEEALLALDKAKQERCEYPPKDLADDMCHLVRLRVENKNYVNLKEYGEKLIEVFNRCRNELSMGYALFHLPWVVEWYKAGRQYKKAIEILENFPRMAL